IRSTGLATMLTTAWFYFHNWLLQPASNATLLGIWAGSALLMTLAWVLNCRLMILEPRLEAISQFPNGTGYKRPGRDTALILPIKNQPRWWHSGLVETQRLSAHIEFFSEDGQKLES